jgi:hypothetical protein
MQLGPPVGHAFGNVPGSTAGGGTGAEARVKDWLKAVKANDKNMAVLRQNWGIDSFLESCFYAKRLSGRNSITTR